ncbi:MAG: SCO family protein [Rubrivivax sp.]|nr:SCO family protein [Rubrivivax sp.]
MLRCADGPGTRTAPATASHRRRLIRRACAVAALAYCLPFATWALDGAGAPAATRTESSEATAREPGAVPTLNEAAALRAAQAAIGRPLPEMVLLDRQGRPVKLADYRGKPLLVSFIYTGCFQVCPTQTRALLQAVQGLERTLGEHQFNIVSIGFNQPFDSPEAMRSFARQHLIEHRNWEFLSPSREAVAQLTNTFGFSYVATPAGFDHVLGVTVVDAAGRIHAQVFGDKLRADQLGEPLRQLLLGTPPAATSTLAAVVERVRILCTVYDPETGEYRYDYKLIFELIGGALFFFSVAIYLLIEWRDQRRARRRSCTPPQQASGSTA